MKVNIMDLIKPPKTSGKAKVHENRFQALQEEDECDNETNVQEKQAEEIAPPGVSPVPVPAFPRAKKASEHANKGKQKFEGKVKLTGAYHPAGCLKKCCESVSTAPSDFLCSA